MEGEKFRGIEDKRYQIETLMPNLKTNGRNCRHQHLRLKLDAHLRLLLEPHMRLATWCWRRRWLPEPPAAINVALARDKDLRDIQILSDLCLACNNKSGSRTDQQKHFEKRKRVPYEQQKLRPLVWQRLRKHPKRSTMKRWMQRQQLQLPQQRGVVPGWE